jgi:hypothetical protein
MIMFGAAGGIAGSTIFRAQDAPVSSNLFASRARGDCNGIGRLETDWVFHNSAISPGCGRLFPCS